MKTDKVFRTEASSGDEKMVLETGKLARLANGSVVAKWGETTVLATAAMSKPNENLDYFPLSVEYIEKFYASGRISSSRFVKRERFPSVEAILSARLIDRSLRPLFPEGFMNEVQIIITVLSYDEVHDPAILGINAASAALTISDIPFEGPVAGINLGLVDDKLKVFPTIDEVADSKLDIVVSSTSDAVVMLEAGANEVAEATILEAIDTAMKASESLHKAQLDLASQVGTTKAEFESKEPEDELVKEVEKKFGKQLEESLVADKLEMRAKMNELSEAVFAEYEGDYTKALLQKVIFKLEKKGLRKTILESDKRLDGRGLDDIRELSSEVGVLPRVHGSGLFSRGRTQVLSVVTLGSSSKEMTIEGMLGESFKRYMHHYNFPPYSTGEAGRYRFVPGRREVGHGALAEKALAPMIPAEDEFPYTIRVVSESMASDGSTSMASTCGSTLALMDAGVPIKKPVGGIAMGLVSDGTVYKVLTDIAGLEDHIGDMDFKVTGTRDGITAIQMDNKLKGVPRDVLEQGLERAKIARGKVLDNMEATISEVRGNLSEFAPKVDMIKIPVSKIGELIGPGGKNIKKIIADTEVDINVEENGVVTFASTDDAQIKRAKQMVSDLTEEAEVGKVYEGVVDKIMPFGAFVNVSESITGLLHISEMSNEFVKDPNTIVKEGQKLKVKVIKIDDAGKVSFTRKGIE